MLLIEVSDGSLSIATCDPSAALPHRSGMFGYNSMSQGDTGSSFTHFLINSSLWASSDFSHLYSLGTPPLDACTMRDIHQNFGDQTCADTAQTCTDDGESPNCFDFEVSKACRGGRCCVWLYDWSGAGCIPTPPPPSPPMPLVEVMIASDSF